MHCIWGNVRELEHALEHAFILCHRNTVRLDHLPPGLRAFGFRYKKDDYCEAIIQALDRTYWNKAEAARHLGISRQHLYRKMKECNIMGD